MIIDAHSHLWLRQDALVGMQRYRFEVGYGSFSLKMNDD